MGSITAQTKGERLLGEDHGEKEQRCFVVERCVSRRHCVLDKEVRSGGSLET